MQMKKIDSHNLVCDAILSWELVSMGIKPIAHFCYEKNMDGEKVNWEFAGEYDPFESSGDVIPAWTMEELAIMIGGDLEVATLPNIKEFQQNLNMNGYYIYFEKNRADFRNGASACAKLLIYYILQGVMTVELANERLEAFANNEEWNPITSENYKKLSTKLKRGK